MAVPITFQEQCTKISFSLYPHQHLLFLVFLVTVILTGVRWISHCGFDLHFPEDQWCPSTFSCTFWPFVCLWQNIHSVILHFFFFATPTVFGSSWARDQTWATAVTRARAVSVSEPYPAEPQENSPFKLDCLFFFFLLLTCMNSLYIWELTLHQILNY